MKFLIADDHPLVRRALILTLEGIRPGATFLEAASLDQTLECLHAHPDVDLVLLDLFMPGGNGLDTLHEVMKAATENPVAVVSADTSPDTAFQALAAGAAGYLPKSLPEDVLRAALGLILVGGIYVPPIVAQATGVTQPHPAPTRPGVNQTRRPPTGEAILTPRQRQVLDLLIEGLSNKEIAERLNLAEATVKVHMTAILRAYGVNSRTKAIGAAQRDRSVRAKSQGSASDADGQP